MNIFEDIYPPLYSFLQIVRNERNFLPYHHLSLNTAKAHIEIFSHHRSIHRPCNFLDRLHLYRFSRGSKKTSQRSFHSYANFPVIRKIARCGAEKTTSEINVSHRGRRREQSREIDVQTVARYRTFSSTSDRSYDVPWQSILPPDVSCHLIRSSVWPRSN